MNHPPPGGPVRPGWTRRDLLKTGAAGAALTVIPAALKGIPMDAFAAPASPSALAAHFQRFGVDEDLVRQAMSEALSRGGEYCDIFFQHNVSTSIVLEDKTVNQAYTRVDLGVGIRVVKGEQVGYSFSEDLSLKALRLAARTAAAIASGAGGNKVAPFRLETHPDYYPIHTQWDKVRPDFKVAMLQRVNDRIYAADPRIVSAYVNYNDSQSHVLIAVSDGRVVYDYRPMCTLGAFCVAEQKGKREDGYYAFSAREGIDYLSEARQNEIAKEVVRRAVTNFEAVKPEGGEMEVVLAPGGAGILLHEAIGHGLEADFNRQKTSIFADKIGKKVAEPFVTVVDDATMPHFRGSLNVDDEGNPTQKTVLVDAGILRSYMHDRISANFYKVPPTGNGRRQSYRFVPIPRMRNTYMMPGPHTQEEIIASVRKGLYAEDFTNGEVMIGAGDFTFYVKSGYLIENGKLTRPVKDVNIIGNGPEVLSRVVMVGNDLKISESTWTCGKNGQGAPVSQGLPTVKVSSVTVGGVKS